MEVCILSVLKHLLRIKQIWWLLASFAWGVIQLAEVLQIADEGNSDWTFGQIAPLVLLFAPIVTVIEYFFDEGNASLIISYIVSWNSL
jgi:hypothetical protein